MNMIGALSANADFIARIQINAIYRAVIIAVGTVDVTPIAVQTIWRHISIYASFARFQMQSGQQVLVLGIRKDQRIADFNQVDRNGFRELLPVFPRDMAGSNSLLGTVIHLIPFDDKAFDRFVRNPGFVSPIQ
ncbi:hypothetical protein D3C77_224760 [compost metagenome]